MGNCCVVDTKENKVNTKDNTKDKVICRKEN